MMFRYLRIIIANVGILVISLAMYSQNVQRETAVYKDSADHTTNDLTLGGYVGIDSIGDINKIVIYTFKMEFQTHFVGNCVHDNFYNLLRGEKVDLSGFPHRVFTERNEIKLLADEILDFPYEGECLYENPELSGVYGLLIRKEKMYINKTTERAVIGLIMIFFNNRAPILLWQYLNNISYKGKEFTTNLYDTQDSTSFYRKSFIEIEDSKPRTTIMY